MSSTSRPSRFRSAAARSARRSTALAGVAGAALLLVATLAPVTSANAASPGSTMRSVEIPDLVDIDTGGDQGTTPPDSSTDSPPPSEPATEPEPTTSAPSTSSDSPGPVGGPADLPAVGEVGSSGSGSSSGSRGGTGSEKLPPGEGPSAPASAVPTTASTPSPSPSPSPSSTAGALLPRVTLSGPLEADAAADSGLLSPWDARFLLFALAAMLLAGVVTFVVRRRARGDVAAVGAADAWASTSGAAVFTTPLPVSDFPALASWRPRDASDAGVEIPSAASGAVDLSPGRYRRVEPTGFFTESTDGDPASRTD